MAAEQTKATIFEQQLLGLSTLLQLQKQCRHVKSPSELGFLVVNDTLRLLQYHQAVLWQKKGSAGRIVAVSGVDRPNLDSPYLLWLKKVCRFLQREQTGKTARVVTKEQLSLAQQAEWDEWMAGEGLWCPLPGADGALLGAVWLKRDLPWQPGEVALLEQLADAYGHAWQALGGRRWQPSLAAKFIIGRVLRVAVIAAALASLALPVELSVLAPARIVPVRPLVVSAPLQGVIKYFHVQPNQQVVAGQELFSIDETELRNRREVAAKALAVAEAELQRATQKSLFDRDSAVDIEVLRARVAIKKAEMQYAADELSRVTVRAERDGIVIFADANDWLGKPVVTGERVLLLADPDRKELELQVPLDNAINLAPGARVRMFLHVNPTLAIPAVIRLASYEAKETPQGTLAYMVKAGLVDEMPELRIGLQGTAKVYGEKTRLYYYLLRRPWAAVRRSLGI